MPPNGVDPTRPRTRRAVHGRTVGRRRPEGDESYRPLHYTRAQTNQARESYQKALADMTALLATN